MTTRELIAALPPHVRAEVVARWRSVPPMIGAELVRLAGGYDLRKRTPAAELKQIGLEEIKYHEK